LPAAARGLRPPPAAREAPMSHSLLFEIGTEELPPSELPLVLRALGETAMRLLQQARLGYESLRVYSTPRRLTVAVGGLGGDQERQTVTVMGPPKKSGFDAAGRPTRAAEGFARAQGVALDRLTTILTERGEYLAVEREEGGQPAVLVLPPLLESLAASLP